MSEIDRRIQKLEKLFAKDNEGLNILGPETVALMDAMAAAKREHDMERFLELRGLFPRPAG